MMTLNSRRWKVSRLRTLAKEISNSIPHSWLFPTVGEVQGFLGTGPIMFVAERPSTGHGYPKVLYSLLEKCGVADGHVTDLIKSRGRVGDPYPDDIGPHRRVFDRELAIVRPRLIVAMGQKVYDLLQFSLAGSGIRIRPVMHYSATRWGGKRLMVLEKQIRAALRT